MAITDAPCPLYQDVAEVDEAADASEVFFELANAKAVSYRSSSSSSPSVIRVQQDPTVQECTGGIVWETAFLLATFLEAPRQDSNGGAGGQNMANHLPLRGSQVLEIGAGCGLLGLVLASHGLHVTLTETTAALKNLTANVADARNAAVVRAAGGTAQSSLLRWDVEEDRESLLAPAAAAASGDGQRKFFDVVVGTDTFFDKALVAPLLATVRAACHERSVVWLCFQERCVAAHAELLRLAPSYFDTVEDASDRLKTTPGCAAAAQLDCWLLRLTGARSAADCGEEEGGGIEARKGGKKKALKKRRRDEPAVTDESTSLSEERPTKVNATASASLSSSSSNFSSSSSSSSGSSWMSAAFARSAARADPDVDEPGSFDDEGFDGKGVAELANQWAFQQQQQQHSMLASHSLGGKTEQVAAANANEEKAKARKKEKEKKGNKKGAEKEKKKKKRQGG